MTWMPSLCSAISPIHLGQLRINLKRDPNSLPGITDPFICSGQQHLQAEVLTLVQFFLRHSLISLWLVCIRNPLSSLLQLISKSFRGTCFTTHLNWTPNGKMWFCPDFVRALYAVFRLLGILLMVSLSEGSYINQQSFNESKNTRRKRKSKCRAFAVSKTINSVHRKS